MKFWSRSPSLPPTASEFTSMVAHRFGSRASGMSVTISGDLQLSIEASDGVVIANLDQFYRQLVASPRRTARIIEDAVRGVKTLVTEHGAGLGASSLVPIIKPQEWVVSAREQARSGGADEVMLVVDNLTDDLVIVYAVDLSGSVEFIGEHQVFQLGLDRAELRDVAVKNLLAMIKTVRPVDHGGVIQLEVDGFYDASLLLFDYLWDDGELPIEDAAVVAVPNRDVVLAVSSRDAVAVQRLRHVAEQSFMERSYPISPWLYLRRERRWERS